MFGWLPLFVVAAPFVLGGSALEVITAGGIKYGFFEGKTPETRCKQKNLKPLLNCLADQEGRIFMTVVDNSFMSQVVNFWESSLLPFGIENYLVVCTTDLSFEAARDLGFPAYRLEIETETEEESWDKASAFKSKNYFAKTHAKSVGLLRLLDLGYKVLSTDSDVHYFTNPLTVLGTRGLDLEGQADGHALNTGLFYARPTAATKRMFQASLNNTDNYDQGAVANFLKATKKPKGWFRECPSDTLVLKVRKLPSWIMSSGLATKPMLRSHLPLQDEVSLNFPQLVAMHNNYIRDIRRKEFRWKSLGLWSADVDLEYSRPKRKLLLVRFPPVIGHDAHRHQMIAMQTANFLAQLLERELILPREVQNRKDDKSVPIGYVIDTVKLHEQNLHEWNFLLHPKIAKLSISPSLEVKGTATSPLEVVERKERTYLGNSCLLPELAPEVRVPEWGAVHVSALAALLSDYANFDVIQLEHLYGEYEGVEQPSRFLKMARERPYTGLDEKDWVRRGDVVNSHCV